jgi:hypothetical protein
MRGHTRKLLRLTTAIAVAAALGASAPQTARAQSAEEAVKQTLVDMWDAIEQGDVARYATYVHDDFTSFGETDTYLNEGKDYELRSVASWIERSSLDYLLLDRLQHLDRDPRAQHLAGEVDTGIRARG